MKQLKKITAFLLAISMICGMLPATAWAAEESTIVIAGSDYQNTNGGLFTDATATDAYNILSKIQETYTSAYGFLFGGDYYAHTTNTTTESTAGKKQLKEEIVDVIYPDMEDDKQVYIQGNHDADSLTTDGTLTTSGAHDTDKYGVYVINEKDYMWYNDNQTTIKNTASALDTYLDEKVNASYNKPIFVLSHLPLHYTNRTVNEGDGQYAKYLYDVLDEAGDNGLNIIFLYGHNHSTAYDTYLGNGSVYLAEGDEITIANEGSTSSYFTDELSFTYMNYGFVGYFGDSDADSTLTMTVFEITDSKVTVSRYDEDGVHNLKSAGGTTLLPSNLSADATVYKSGQTITLTTPAVATSKTDNGVTVTAPGLTGLTVTKQFGTANTESYDSGACSAYASYDIATEGITSGNTATVTITLDTADGFSASEKVVIINQTTGEKIEKEIVNGTVTFTTTNDGVFDVVQYKYETIKVPVVSTEAEGTIWRQVTTITPGKKYMLVNYGDNASGVSTFAVNSKASGTAVTVQTDSIGAYIENTDMTLGWLANDSAELTNVDTGDYLYASTYPSGTDGVTVGVTSSITTKTSYSSWKLATTGTNETSLSVFRYGSSNYYPVRYSDGNSSYLAYTSTQTGKHNNWIAIFELTSEGNSSSVTTSGGNWVTITEPTDGTTTYTYTQVTSITAGKEYVIVGNDNDVALMDNDGSLGSQTVTISGTTMTSTVALTEWTFSGSGSGTIYDGNYYLRYDQGFKLDESDSTLTFTKNNSGSNFRIWRDGRTDYSFYYNGSAWTRYEGTRYVRLYQLTDSTTTGGTEGLYGKISGDLTYTVANGTTAEAALAAVKAGITVYYTSDNTSSTGSVYADDADGMTWTLDSSYDGTTPGEYAVTISYNGTVLGVAKVVVPDPNNTTTLKVYTDSSSGTVKQNSTSMAKTGTVLTITDADGNVIETVNVTLGMLKDADGNAVSTDTVGTITGLDVYYTYNGVEYKVFENYTLNVVERIQNNYPDYPNEGAVKVNKTATGIDFQSSGVAQVELSVSGVPSKKGVDVIVMVDTSSSMKRGAGTNSEVSSPNRRIDFLQSAVANMIKQFQTPGDDGEALDIRVAIAEFNGYTHISTDQTLSETKVQDAENVAEVFTGSKAIDAEAFVDATSITDPDSFAAKIGEHSGTNYDYAFDTIYRLGSAIQAENEANQEERDLSVIFMSDGAPYQYNYYGSGTNANWNSYLLGESGEFDTDLLGGSYTCFYNAEGKHWMAEAVKGDTDKTYQVIDPTKSLGDDADVSGDGDYFRLVPGLGAEVHAIGFCLYDDSEVLATTQQAVMTKLASVDDYGNALVYFTESAEGLEGAFSDIASKIAYAATNAYFLDQMGDAFELQLATVNYAPEGSTEKTETITPVIEVKSYDIYTRQDFSDGLCDESEIGNRKGTYTVLETVTFSTDGTKAYSSLIDVDKDGTYGVTVKSDGSYTIDEGDNILGTDGVIYAYNFAYNTTTAAVTVNGITVAAESFYWYVGTVTTSELAISYYVYLSGSMDGECESGSYKTNNYATLYYDNYLGNASHKDTTSPTVAWESALVKYAFYLVDGKGNPVNNNGETVTFANKYEVTQPVIYQEILLNNLDQVSSIEVESLANLPEGYTLYDDKAVYTITINSNSTGSWLIEQGKEPATTYVMQYNPDNGSAYSNALTANSSSYDYTHTVVWFAVVWTPQCIPDTVVIDYGLPVDIHVLNNDMFGVYGKLVGITNETVTGSLTGDATNQVVTTTATGAFGSAQIITSDNALDVDDYVVRYTPTSMEMNDCETLTYSVEYTGSTNSGYYYGTVTVIPATTVYYEDSYVSYSVWNQNTIEKIGSDWETVGEAITDVLQAEDRPGQYSYSSVDANNLYGYDSAYSTCSTYSLGSAKKITASADQFGKAEFSFYGTGFDIISLTSDTTGTITVSVKSDDGDVTKNLIVDTYYGYVYDEETEKWIVNPEADDALYQVPIIKVSDLPYDKYNVTITAAYLQGLDHKTDDSVDEEGNPVKSEYDFYLDAIRIYDPVLTSEMDVATEDLITDSNPDGKYSVNQTAVKAYKADKEGWPVYKELRNLIIEANKFDIQDTTDDPEDEVPGIVFIDGDSEVGTSQIEDYKNYGPNNEIYLKPGQAIAFKLWIGLTGEDEDGNLKLDKSNIASVQLAIKSVEGTAYSQIWNADSATSSSTSISTVSTATDLYYDITNLNGHVVVIMNPGDTSTEATDDGAILSITNIKVTYAEDPSGVSAIGTDTVSAGTFARISRSSVNVAMLSMYTVDEEITPKDTIVETPEDTTVETLEDATVATPEVKVEGTVADAITDKTTSTVDKAEENISNEKVSYENTSDDVSEESTMTEGDVTEDVEADSAEKLETEDSMTLFGRIWAIIKDFFKMIVDFFAGLV